MENLALKLICEEASNSIDHARQPAVEVQLMESAEQDVYVFFRGNLIAQYQKRDNYSRNIILAQLFLCHRVAQQILSDIFQLTIPHISSLIGNYRRAGSTGIEDHTVVRIGNNKKIKGEIAAAIIKQLDVSDEERPTYAALAQSIKRKFNIDLTPHRIGCWWRQYRKDGKQAQAQSQAAQISLISEETTSSQNDAEGREKKSETTPITERNTEKDDNETEDLSTGQWQANNVAGSFILYAMLDKSQFLKPFTDTLKQITQTGRKSIERVMLTLFFMHALRLKSIEQTKHLLSYHFSPLVLGTFCRLQSLRYAIDEITEQKQFDQAITEHHQNLCQHTELGDDIYYTDGHFSCYYGKHAIPKGYDARKKQPARGRNTVYLHNSMGHNILSYESPTNTMLSVDIETLIEKMKQSYGNVKGKTLFFDRGGFSADCFKKTQQTGMYFTTYLKQRKKQAELDESLFEEIEINIHGTLIKNRLYETQRQRKAYGTLRTIIFIGKRGKQIPVISTNLTLSAAEIIARLQKRWVEENGFKYMDEHFNIDLLTSYETEEAPDKIMSRPNPKRKAANKAIAAKKMELKELKEQYATKLNEVTNKGELTIAGFEEQEKQLKLEIKTAEVELGILELKRKEIPGKVESNMKDESVISCQKRRLFINLVKTMNYNCEKWLQLIFCQYHPKADETLSLIRHVLTQPGRIRQRGRILEVELERLDSGVQANTLDKVLKKFKEDNHLTLPDGRKLVIWQAL